MVEDRQTAKCVACGEAIVYNGMRKYWEHVVGRPRHIAEPHPGNPPVQEPVKPKVTNYIWVVTGDTDYEANKPLKAFSSEEAAKAFIQSEVERCYHVTTVAGRTMWQSKGQPDTYDSWSFHWIELK